MPMTRKELLLKHKYKFAALFISVFCLTCLSLCAEEMNTERAKSYRENFVTEAKKYIGCSYVYGAAGPDVFDCSGLIYYVAREANKTQLPRTANALYQKAKAVSDEEREPGDLVFFKTTSSGNISHVGIYIGNNQFISAVSDGPNTGVILSSINEGYWNPRYIGAGQIYKSGKLRETTEEKEPQVAEVSEDKVIEEEPAVAEVIPEKETGTSAETTTVSAPSKFNKGDYLGFLEDTIIDTSLYGSWAILNSESFMLNFRGLDLTANARLAYRNLGPGVGLGIKWNYWMGLVQIPLTFSLTLNDYVRFYMGPVFSLGNGKIHDSEEEISASIFPGILGMALSTPVLKIGPLGFQLVQDISYSFFSKPDNSALSFYKSLSSGLVFNSGLRVTMPQF